MLTPLDPGAVLREATLNAVLDSSFFEFEVPAGIDVIGDVPTPSPDAARPEQPAPR